LTRYTLSAWKDSWAIAVHPDGQFVKFSDVHELEATVATLQQELARVSRLQKLAEQAAFNNHCENSHPESFDVCIHDDCVLVRAAVRAGGVSPTMKS
jgi:hypothetical protein